MKKNRKLDLNVISAKRGGLGALNSFTILTPYEVQKEILDKTYIGKNILNKRQALIRNLINYFI